MKLGEREREIPSLPSNVDLKQVQTNHHEEFDIHRFFLFVLSPGKARKL